MPAEQIFRGFCSLSSQINVGYEFPSFPSFTYILSNMAWNRGSTVGVVCRLQFGQTRNRGSFPGRSKRYSSTLCRLAPGATQPRKGTPSFHRG